MAKVTVLPAGAGLAVLAASAANRELDSVKKYIRYGASPRGMQTLILAGKVRALLEGRFNVAFEDLAAVAAPALRHRIFLQFEAEADAVSSDQVVSDVLEQTQKDPSQK